MSLSGDSTTAWVTLQENNAIAEVNLVTGTITDIYALGTKDHATPGKALDAVEEGEIRIRNWPLNGLFQPDTIDSFEFNGSTYLVTANEGDARDYDGYSEEADLKDLSLDSTLFPNAVDLKEAIGDMGVTTAIDDSDGDGNFEEIHVFGARSFSIWTATGGLVYDSGDDFEQILARDYPTIFNSQGTPDSFDERSENKGPEPEALTLGEVGGRTIAFIGLERASGIMIYDVDNPLLPQFLSFVPSYDFVNDQALEISPEGSKFISADSSPNNKPLLLIGNEVTGNTTIYEVVSE